LIAYFISFKAKHNTTTHVYPTDYYVAMCVPAIAIHHSYARRKHICTCAKDKTNTYDFQTARNSAIAESRATSYFSWN